MKKLILLLVFGFCCLTIHAQTADELFTKGDYAKAADAYAVLYKADTTNLTNTRRLAFCYLQSTNAQHLAHYYFQKALNINANDVASNYYMGVYYKDLLAKLPIGKQKPVKDNAIMYLTKAVSLGSEEAKEDLKNLK